MIIFNHLATFAPITVYNILGWGIQYQGIRFSGYFLRSVGNIDDFASEYKKNTNLSIDVPHPNYKYMFGQFISLSVNLFSKNVAESQNQ